MLGLGFYGKGETKKAKTHLMEAAKMDINHQDVQVHFNGLFS